MRPSDSLLDNGRILLEIAVISSRRAHLASTVWASVNNLSPRLAYMLVVWPGRCVTGRPTCCEQLLEHIMAVTS